MKIGIIGLGFVGEAISKAHDWMDESICIDIDPKKNCKGTYEQLDHTDGVYVCVPSPMKSNGECDTSILDSVLVKLKTFNYKQPIISKVTAPPQAYTKWSEILPNLVYSPEFLTAANAYQDYIQTDFIVVGGTTKAYQREAALIIEEGIRGPIKKYYCTLEEASLMKYTINSFLATKVSFMNEIYRVALANGIDYNIVAELVKLDKRIGTSHMKVPGEDGFGFGGMCFPKDTLSMTHFAGIDMPILKKVIEQNDLVRGS
jgi:UDPglucose 6-dehydrogenase